MTIQVRRALMAALFPGVPAGALKVEMAAPTAPPEAPKFKAQTEPVYVNRSDIFEFKALPAYSAPAWVTAFVDAGKLPPLAERLPKEPLVYTTASVPDGPGVYGDVMRHVIGGRPEGWNFWAGQSFGLGGIGLVECLTRTGPLFTVNAADLQPLPNLAKAWEWSEDRKTLTIHLIEGAKWSDGAPFNAEDIEFYWNDVIMDENVTPLMGASPATYNNAAFAKVDDYTFTLTFPDPFPEQVLYAMAYGNFCPGPAHILKPKHPKYGGESYESFLNAFPSDFMNFPTMGGWTVVEHRPDDIVVLRRNPYCWKVDETGQQLPYLDEMQYRLSTWGDRDVQTVAGTGDFSNLEQPENFVESLKKAADPASPARLAFGPRMLGYQLLFNTSANGWGEPDARAQGERELNRNLDFRKAMTYAMDRQRLGDSLVKGPFTAPYPGGLLTSTSHFDAASTVCYPFSVDSSKESLAAAGLTDGDGNGFVDAAGGGDLTVTLLVNSDYATDKNLAEAVMAMMVDVGVKVTLNSLTGKDYDNAREAGSWDWMVRRNDQEFVSVVQGTESLAPVGPMTASWHRANAAGEVDVRLMQSVPVPIVMSFITFMIIQAPPGDYGDFIRTNMIVQGGASPEAATAAANEYREPHGPNDPLLVQYVHWIWDIVSRGDFGQSYADNKPVSGIPAQRLPPTIAIALTCLLLATVIGVGLGMVEATRQYTRVDTVLSFVAFMGMTIPRFLLALIILYILVFKLNVQEIGSFDSSRYGGLAYNMRVMRANLLDTQNTQYIETARAKGLGEGAVILRHAVPNALHPLVAYQGVVLPYMLTGEIEVAIVFGLATIGLAIVGSMAIGDVYVTATLLLVLGATLIIGNIIADLLLAVLDPRIRVGGN